MHWAPGRSERPGGRTDRREDEGGDREADELQRGATVFSPREPRAAGATKGDRRAVSLPPLSILPPARCLASSAAANFPQPRHRF